MDRKQAQKYIKDHLQIPFNQEKFKAFVQNLLNDVEPRDDPYRGNLLWEAFQEHISQYRRIGKYTDPNGETLDILVIETKSLSKLERARTALRNFVVRHLKKFGEKDQALAAFYSKEDQGADWRFSFIKIEHESYKDEKGNVKLRTEFTPAKRYSFLVGENEDSYTAQEQLVPLLEMDYANPTIEEIEQAFSIEKVTDEFFRQYKELYSDLSEHFENNRTLKAIIDQNGLEVSRFTKKLLGQIVFLYFLQKKGWLGVDKNNPWGSGDKKFLQKRFAQTEANQQNFYHDFLQFLFYEALAKDRRDSDDPDYYPRFNCKIPFLNGGLFEADYDWQSSPLSIPNQLFRNQRKNHAGDEGMGILDVFDRYNFTIKEDEPLEKEVAVDPEMLGKVFENMLEVTERKSKGAFYTPREIVHYMCQESLIHYLDNSVNSYAITYQELGEDQTDLFGNAVNEGQLTLTEEHQHIKVPQADIETLIRKGHLFLENDVVALEARKKIANNHQKTTSHKIQLPDSIQTQAALLDEKLARIKICDPAIGSGAFPVGLLHEIVNARLVLKTFIESEQKPYDLKRHAIQESIYGVDTDASAIDIARLRLWLSLIVDEEDFANIEALPNLDYKIVQGDSLIGFSEEWQGNTPRVQEIEGLKSQFFYETDPKKKSQLKSQIDQKIAFILENSKNIVGCEVGFDFKLFFSEVWHQNEGFDVVIGNPPYRQIQKFSDQQKKDWETQNYQSFTKTGDIYCLFYEKGNTLLRNNGALTFITSNKWMRANYGRKLRKFFLDQVNIQQLIDFGDSPIFEATTYTNILLFSKNDTNQLPDVWDLSHAYQVNVSLDIMLSENSIGSSNFSEDAFLIVPQKLAFLKKRIEENGIPLKEWNVSIYYGIKTGFNEAFVIDGKTKNELIEKDPKSAEIIKPVLRGRDIKRYKINFADLWLIATFPALNLGIDDYPAVRDYLKSFDKKLHQKGEEYIDANGQKQKSRKKTGNRWFETQDQIAYHQQFEKEKLVYAEIVYDSAFYYDKKKHYPDVSTFILTGENIKYLTALLNSKLLTYSFKAFYAGGDLRGNTFRYKKVFLENLPIPQISKDSQIPFEILVDYILVLKEQAEKKLESAYFEQLIDGMVFELYFAEEIRRSHKEILPSLGELRPITDDMTEEAKLAVIQSEFDRLYDPNHPVRNNLETLDSVEEVRIIQEALR